MQMQLDEQTLISRCKYTYEAENKSYNCGCKVNCADRKKRRCILFAAQLPVVLYFVFIHSAASKSATHLPNLLLNNANSQAVETERVKHANLALWFSIKYEERQQKLQTQARSLSQSGP
jgi:hypothetical protein